MIPSKSRGTNPTTPREWPRNGPLAAVRATLGHNPLRALFEPLRAAQRLVTLLALALLLVLLATPSADAAVIRTFPLEQKPTDLGVHTIIIEAPRRAWGIRTAAAVIDRQVEGLDIWAKRGIRCMPTVTCIRVTKERWGITPERSCTGRLNETWVGCAQLGGTDPYVWLNASWRIGRYGRARIGCHELLHALGLDHHSLHGCLGSGPGRLPSRVEIDTVRGLYP